MLLLTDHTDRESSVPLRPLPYCNVLSMQFSGFLQNLPTRHAVFFSHDGPYTIRLANGGIAHSFESLTPSGTSTKVISRLICHASGEVPIF
ncbi:hypothetical protein HGRIS_005681 [Hohenbuehelia grisea]|uniref:Uncharacterized protein n=1 Tax=Hohenbuehelia grisea TaxID=104357 RepID=A0ABR3JZF6_9AGAR